MLQSMFAKKSYHIHDYHLTCINYFLDFLHMNTEPEPKLSES